jgi:hypothetical protein
MPAVSTRLLLIMQGNGGMMGKAFGILVASVMGAGVPAAAVAEPLLWQGSIVIFDATPACNAFAELRGSWGALYRPRLKSGDPNAAIFFQKDDLSHILVLQATTSTSSMNGSGPYCGSDSNPAKGDTTDWCGGSYQHTVTPANVTANTDQVTISGRMTYFGNIAGCTIRYRAAFQWRPETGPGL